MELSISIPEDLVQATPSQDWVEFQAFLQCLTNRRVVGALRYENYRGPNRRARYLDRIKKEVAKYQQTGNYEQLLNVAVYCYLESQAPQHSRFHHDPDAASATRAAMTLEGEVR